ncbi:MAG: hypothetical protein WCQ99_15555, partial [Pseudomonadota bacterium]
LRFYHIGFWLGMPLLFKEAREYIAIVQVKYSRFFFNYSTPFLNETDFDFLWALVSHLAAIAPTFNCQLSF